MLNTMDPLFQRLQPLARLQLHLLRDNRLPGIHLGNHLMDHHTRALKTFFFPRFPRTLNGARARKLARQCGVQVYDLDARGSNGRKERGRHNVHPAGANDEIRPRRRGEDDVGQVGVVGGAGVGEVVWMLLFVGDEVVVRCLYGSFGGTFEAVGGFATAWEIIGSDDRTWESRVGRKHRLARRTLKLRG